MGLETYYRITSYALIATSFTALALTGELDAVSVVVYPVVLVFCFYADARGLTRLRLREWMWRALALIYIPFIFVDASLLSDRILALVHMTLFLSGVKLFQNKRDRDWVFLYLIAFFQMLLAAGLTFDTTFVASLIAFIFFFISTLAAFEIRRARSEVASVNKDEETIIRTTSRRIQSRSKEKPGSSVRKPTGRVRYLVGASMAQVALVALLTLPFFFFIPRFGGGGVARGWGEGQSMTGFSQTVNLGEVAQIKESSRVVMHVQLSSRPTRPLRWHGIALDNYDGRSWKVADYYVRTKTSGQNLRRGGEVWQPEEDFKRLFIISDPRTERPPLLEQKIVLEPLKINVLFAAQRLVKLRADVSKIHITRDTGDDPAEASNAVFADSLRGRTSYTAFSDISSPSEEDLRADSSNIYSPRIEQLYLQKPLRLDPRIGRLAREITHGASTPYDKARAIESYLKSNFGYTLNLKPTEGDPLAEFLFEVREGHCEYFATAMAIMLRTLNIPARIVNGFQMGEYNDVNDVFTVRERDAHSWVEVYFPQTDSWVEFDPTPAAGINDYSQNGIFAGLRKYLEAAEMLWLDYVVTLDSDEQASLMVEIQHRLVTVKDRVLAYYTSAKNGIKDLIASYLLTGHRWTIGDVLRLVSALGTLLLTLVGAYVILSYMKRRRLAPTGYGPWWHRLFILPTWRRARLTGRDHRTSAVLFYEQMLAISARAGLIKQPDQTPREFAAQSDLDQIREITAVYNRVRFGGAQLTQGETRHLALLLAELKKTVRRLKRSKKKKQAPGTNDPANPMIRS